MKSYHIVHLIGESSTSHTTRYFSKNQNAIDHRNSQKKINIHPHHLLILQLLIRLNYG